MKWELLVSIRYLLAKRREKFISVTTFLSVLSVTIGVAALIIVLGVMSGFGDKLREKITGFNYHINIESAEGIKEPALIIDSLKDNESIISAGPFIDGQAIILADEREPRGILMRGMDPAAEREFVDIDVIKGSLELGENEIAIGNEMAKLLRVSRGEHVSIISGANIKPKKFLISAIFHSGMYDYDANVVFSNLSTAQNLFNRTDSVQGVGLRLKSIDIAEKVKKAILPLLGRGYIVNTWSELNKNLFAAIRMEKILVFIVVTLTIAVGALNIVNTLSLLTLEKTKDIGILKALGATRLSVAAIYMFKGLIIGLFGSAAGLSIGLLIANRINEISGFISRFTGFELFSREIYYLDKIPVSINYSELWIIACFAVGLSFLATLYPAWHASRLDPIEALRYE